MRGIANMFATRVRVPVGVLLLASLAGCGPEPVKDDSRTEVSGVVTFDGKPLPAGVLTFRLKDSPKATQMSIRDEGRYRTDRVPIGPNLVSIETVSIQSGSPGSYVPIPSKYSDVSTSGLEVEVKPGINENVNFDLKP